MPSNIFSAPQTHAGSIIDGIDGKYCIGFRERNPAWGAHFARFVEDDIVQSALGSCLALV